MYTENEENISQIFPFWDKLTPSEQRFVKDGAVRQKMPRGAFIDSGSCLGMITVMSGDMRAYLLSEEGREVTLFHMISGDNCVLTASCIMATSSFGIGFTAESDTDICLLPSETFNRLAEENVYVKCFMYQRVSERFADVMMTVQAVLFKKADRRIADYFLAQNTDNIYITQEKLATEIGTAREVVTRILKNMADDGVIVIGRGHIRLLNKEKLKKLQLM